VAFSCQKGEKMQIEKIKIGELKAATYNPRKDLKPGDKEFEKLKRSIEEFGYVEPIIWNKRTGNVVGGHQRLKVLSQLGYTEVECVVLDVDASKEKALNIALNKISGEWDMPLLTELLRDLDSSGFEVSLTGFEISELDSLFKETLSEKVKEDDFDLDKEIEKIKIPITKRGDVWVLGGKHRIMCGDSTSLEDVKVLMDGNKAKFMFTDPPWNVDYGGAAHPSWKQRSILNDKMTSEQFAEFLTKAFSCAKEVMETGGMTYVVMSGQEWGNIMRVMEALSFHWSSTIIWKKDTLVLSRKDYHTQFEPIWYGWIDGTRLCPLTDRKQSDVWDIARPKRSELHPTTKPVELVARAILNSSHKGELCIDLFGGSGTTLIASEQTERLCYMMELDEKYADVIVKRYLDNNPNMEAYVVRNGVKLAFDELKAVDKEE